LFQVFCLTRIFSLIASQFRFQVLVFRQ